MSTDQHTLPDGRTLTWDWDHDSGISEVEIDGEPAPKGAITELAPRPVKLAWCLKTKVGAGWVREVYKGRAIITSVISEAEQYPSKEAALTLAAQLDHPGHIPLVPDLVEVDGPPQQFTP